MASLKNADIWCDRKFRDDLKQCVNVIKNPNHDLEDKENKIKINLPVKQNESKVRHVRITFSQPIRC